MFNQKRLMTVLTMSVLLALLGAALMPFAALADDSAPAVMDSCNPPAGSGGKKPSIPVLRVIAVTTPLAEDKLPGALPEGKTFADGMSVKLLLNSVEIDRWTPVRRPPSTSQPA